MNQPNEITPLQQTNQARARSKHITNAIVFKMAELDSPLSREYWNAYHCAGTIEQTGNRIKGRYCNKRWCITCNRIRTAKLINGYGSQIAEFEKPVFVTLTAKNIPGDQLPDRIKEYNEVFTRIRKNIKKTYGHEIKGVRKLEVTHNPRKNEFHPHYHLIMNDPAAAGELVNLWLKAWGAQADIKAQDIRPAVKGSTNELFKYVVKLEAKGTKGIEALDVIFRALKGRRLVSSYGIKQINEDVEETQNTNIDWKEPGNYLYHWNSSQADWIRGDGDKLTGYIMDEKTRATVDRILRGHIDIDLTPPELENDISELVDFGSWGCQLKPVEVDALELELINKMIERDNPRPIEYKPKPKTPEQTRLNL